MIRLALVTLPKSPTNLAQGDEVPQIITRITRQQPSEILHLLQNDFCDTIDHTTDIGDHQRYFTGRFPKSFGYRK
jgi:hypothetical protein